jgi:hypothetical protein
VLAPRDKCERRNRIGPYRHSFISSLGWYMGVTSSTMFKCSNCAVLLPRLEDVGMPKRRFGRPHIASFVSR